MFKTQVVVNGKTKAIIDICQGEGHKHDFNVYKRKIGATIREAMPVYADLGYLGIDMFRE